MIIECFYESDFPDPAPALELLFPDPSGLDTARGFIIYEERDVVFLGESIYELLLVLVHSPYQVVGNADVKGSGPVGHDVDVILTHEGMYCGILDSSSLRSSEKHSPHIPH